MSAQTMPVFIHMAEQIVVTRLPDNFVRTPAGDALGCAVPEKYFAIYISDINAIGQRVKHFRL